jgi:sacsin
MDRAKLLIPDKELRLRPFSKVFYNDIGENHRFMNSDGHFIAHQSVDESLARKLSLDRLGLRYTDLQNVGPNMGQAPIVTVRRSLQQYTHNQFLLEFLANAEDAKATEFKVAINLTSVHEDQNLRLLSSDMAYLCKLPSLVVYNNEQFTSHDFEGICRTNEGGKEGRPDTIGEFGQGVLTMYHFTDVCCDFFLLFYVT